MLSHTLKKQTQGLILFGVCMAVCLFGLSELVSNPSNYTDIFPMVLQFLSLTWPIISSSLLFGQEFRDASLPYLLGAPQARSRILKHKILPAMLLALLPWALIQSILSIGFPNATQLPALGYALIYFIVWATAFTFSFFPSLITTLVLTLSTSTLFMLLIPVFSSWVFSWKEGVSSPRRILRYLFYFPMDIKPAIWLVPILPLTLLILWIRGFLRYASPDHRRTYRKMIPKGGLILTGTAVLIFIVIYIFLPVYPWGTHHLTREGHLFFHGYSSSKLITGTDTYTLQNGLNSDFLAETDGELILTSPGDKDQIDLIGWNKTNGRVRLISSLPAKPSLKMIFQPPQSILCLPADNPDHWMEIDIQSGQVSTQSDIRFPAENHGTEPNTEEKPKTGNGLFGRKGKKYLFPILRLKDGKTEALLTSFLPYYWSGYSTDMDLYICRSDKPAELLSQSRGIPLQFNENEILLISDSRGTIERYQFIAGELTLIHSAPYPKTSFYAIKRDFRFWPTNQPLVGLSGQPDNRTLLQVEFNPLSIRQSPLPKSEQGLYFTASTPYWNALVHHLSDRFRIQRLDQDQPPIEIMTAGEKMRLSSQVFGFLIYKSDEDWLPTGRIRVREAKIEFMPRW